MINFIQFVYRVFIAAFTLFAGASIAKAQSPCEDGGASGNFSITIDTVATNIGLITDLTGVTTDLTGYSTYKLYLQCEASDDLLQAVAGDSVTPVSITTTTSFYQSELGSTSESNPALFLAYPQVEYDSFLSIGLEATADANAGESPTQIVEDSDVLPISGAFENGENLIIDSNTGSSWYIADAESATNCAAGDDLKILFAQVTTDGDINGDLQFQVYRNGVQSAENCYGI